MADILHGLKIELWIVQTLAMIVTALLLPGFTVSGPLSAFLAVMTLAFVNTHIWDTALFFSVPNSISMHALTLIVANGVVFWLLMKILPGIETRGILAPLIAPILFTVISLFLHHYTKEINWRRTFMEAKESVSAIKEEIKKQNPTSARSEP